MRGCESDWSEFKREGERNWRVWTTSSRNFAVMGKKKWHSSGGVGELRGISQERVSVEKASYILHQHKQSEVIRNEWDV